jgi:acylphosphatase
MSTDQQQLHAIVRGLVQGVNFRAGTVARARQLRLAGWVRNRDDGSVEVLAEGPRPALEQLLAFLRRGPVGARVTEVQPTWQPAGQGLRGFEVRW